MSLKSQVGKKAGPFQDLISQDRISSFRKSIGADESSIAPPTFLTVFRKGEFDLFQELGLELSRVLHAEQEYQYQGQIEAGDRVHFETALTHVLEKQSSSTRMQFLTFETEFKSEKASRTIPVGKSKTTIVVREKV